MIDVNKLPRSVIEAQPDFTKIAQSSDYELFVNWCNHEGLVDYADKIRRVQQGIAESRIGILYLWLCEYTKEIDYDETQGFVIVAPDCVDPVTLHPKYGDKYDNISESGMWKSTKLGEAVGDYVCGQVVIRDFKAG